MTKSETRRDNPGTFWEERYRQALRETTGRPGVSLRRFVESLAPSTALELGCGKGDDAVWLATLGWSVLAVDISQTAIEIALANAAKAVVSDRITFERHNLAQSFPSGYFDLVAASFLAAFPRETVFRQAAEAVAKGGHLLIIDHGSRPPWSSASPDRQYLSAAETLESLELDERDWQQVFVGSLERSATGPEGENATLLDNVVFLKRLKIRNRG